MRVHVDLYSEDLSTLLIFRTPSVIKNATWLAWCRLWEGRRFHTTSYTIFELAAVSGTVYLLTNLTCFLYSTSTPMWSFDFGKHSHSKWLNVYCNTLSCFMNTIGKFQSNVLAFHSLKRRMIPLQIAWSQTNNKLQHYEPLTWHNAPYAHAWILAFLFMGYLTRRPQTHTARLLFLPVVIFSIFRCTIQYRLEDQRFGWYNWIRGMSMLRIHYDYSALAPGQGCRR